MEISLKKLSAVTLAVLIFCVIDLASAHHSFAMFDRAREEVTGGEVVRWAFNSPHVALYIRDDAGVIFAYEGAAPASLVTRDEPMNGFTFQPGDSVDLVVCPLSDGRNGGALGIIIKDDVWYMPNDGGCGPNQESWQDWMGKGYMSKQEAIDAGEEIEDM